MATYYGSNGNDTIFGTVLADSIYGYAGNDYLWGSDGNDFLQGAAGADILDGGNGIDTVDYNGTAGVTVNLATGYGYGGEAEGDRLYNIENVQGTASYNDYLYGSAANNVLSGYGGNDFLQGGAGADTLNGGAGIDTADYNGNAGVYVDLASGYGYYGEAAGDRLFDIENVQGTTGYADTLYGSAVANVLSGYGGNDYLYGRDGNDTLNGSDGNDFLQGGNGADALNGGAGIDTIDYNGAAGVYVNLTTGTGSGGEAQGDVISGVENVQGTTGYADSLYGSALANILSGYGGNDTLVGYDGNDTLNGSDGNDFLQGGNGADSMSGGAGIDTIDYNGTAGVYVDLTSGYGYYGEAAGDRLYDIENVQGTTGYGDTLYGSAVANVLSGYGGNDYLYGRDGNDTLNGMDGNDFLQGGNGADALNGGAGIDTIDYNGTAGVYVNLTTGTGSGGEAQGDVITGVENVQGTTGYADSLYGSAVANVLSGYGGNDYLYGYDGNDTLNGMDGNDFLQGGNGADTLNGGAGIDTIDYNGTAGVTVNLTTGTGIGGEAQGDVIIGVENVQGTGSYGDTLTGSADANGLYGYGGNDILRGAAGADHLDGGSGIDTAMYTESTAAVTVNLATGLGAGGTAAGDVLVSIENLYGSNFNDVMIGTADANTFVGNAGNDVLQGGAGKDTLAGGAGADRFVYTALGDSPVGANADRITDFSHAQADRIDLSLIDANTTLAGNQAFSFIGAAAFTHHAGELHATAAAGITTISGDVNGDAVADFSIALTGTIALVAADFLL
jgi:Ca2+-binding RTX toxin-like protein